MIRGRPRSSQRPRAENFFALDVRSLPPSPPLSDTVRRVFGEAAAVRLDLTLTVPRTRKQVNVTLFTTTTRPYYGGTRRWFYCGCCGRRAGKLFSRYVDPRFACRCCWRLVYGSQYDKDPGTVLLRRWILRPPSMTASARRQRAKRWTNKLLHVLRPV